MNSDSPSLRVSLRDVAKKLALSHTTVSLALRNHPRITLSVREKVQEMAREMGYRPDPMLSALAHYRERKGEPSVRSAVAWLNYWPKPSELYHYREFEGYIKGATKAAEKFGYRLEEFICTDPKSPHRVETILRNRGIVGVLIPPQPTTPPWANFPWEQFSAVRLGRSCETPKVHLVTADQLTNTVLAVNMIHQRGYPRVGFVCGNAYRRGAQFIAGYMLSQFEVQPADSLPPLVFHGDHASNLRNLTQWIKQYKPDAILTDVSEVREMLESTGYRVPDDIGLAVESVLDGKADAGINQHPEEIGRVAFLMVMSLINDHALGIPSIFRQILVEGDWQDGSTLPQR